MRMMCWKETHLLMMVFGGSSVFAAARSLEL